MIIEELKLAFVCGYNQEAYVIYLCTWKHRT